MIKNKSDWDKLLVKAKNGDGQTMNEVASHLEYGIVIDEIEIVSIDYQASFEWTKKSYESGDLDGMVDYAHHLSYPKNNVCEKNLDLALKIYKEAMKQGSVRATHSIGLEYRNKQNFSKALEYYLIAEEAEKPYKDFSIALCHYYGIGTIKDKEKAFEILQTMAKDNCSSYDLNEANYLIGKIYLEGEIVKQDLVKARKYLELADEDGDHRSATHLLFIIGRSDLIN